MAEAQNCEAEIEKWRQAAMLEARMRREGATEIERLRALIDSEASRAEAAHGEAQLTSAEVVAAFRNADDLDWKHLLSFIPESGHGRFWKEVFAEVRAALARATGAAA